MNKIISLWHMGVSGLNSLYPYVGMLTLRLLLAYEFWESGVMKFTGSNWFMDIQDAFPFPFNLLPASVSWEIATWSELLGAIALIVGLGTRFFSFSLIIVTIVAWVSVHSGNGFNVCSNGWKMPLIYLVMFIPLLFGGPGKLSLDHWLSSRVTR
ncbi:MAG: DoxX family protein [Thioalkalispiraceae bacterium]|jgi:putative oxidoreductase